MRYCVGEGGGEEREEGDVDMNKCEGEREEGAPVS